MMGTQDSRSLLAFFGRQPELAELQYLLEHGTRLISVIAPGGYGKSRLVYELLNSLKASQAFDCYQVPLAAVADHQRIPWLTAEALGLALNDALPPERQLIDFLTGKKSLIYYDNFEHLLAGAELLDRLLMVDGVQILVSSREPLQLAQEHVYQLKPLPVGGHDGVSKPEQYSPAVKLFANRAQIANAGFIVTPDNVNQVIDVCSALAGVPLAIELTAAWADRFDLARLQDEIRHQLDIKARGEDIPARHRSVRASCDWSYGLLDEYQQMAVRVMSVFRGGFDMNAAAAVLPSIDLEDTLAVLHNKNWLDVRQFAVGWLYTMHNEAIREYAYQRLLSCNDFDVAVNAHSRYFGKQLAHETARLHTGEQVEALRHLDAMREDVYFAVESAVHKLDEATLRPLAECLHEYLLLKGAAKTCARYYEDIRTHAARQGYDGIVMVADYALAVSYRNFGDYEKSKRHCELCKAKAVELQKLSYAALADVIYADCCRIEGDHKTARLRYFAGLEQLRALGDKHGISVALFGLGRTAEIESDHETARELILEALYIDRELGDKYSTAHCLNSLGNMAYREGNYEEARQMIQESLKLRRQLGDRRGIAQSLSNLGNVAFAECDYEAAWTLYSESLAIRQDIGEKFGIAASLNNMGNVQYCVGNYEEAKRLLKEALALKREIRDSLGCSFSLNNLANTCVRTKDYSAAARYFQEALTIARDVGSIECILAPIAISCKLLAELDKHAPASAQAAGAREQYSQSGLSLDPMDRGMIEDAEHESQQALLPEELARQQALGVKMSLPELIAFTLDNLIALENELPKG